jgi:phage gpG-like protein
LVAKIEPIASFIIENDVEFQKVLDKLAKATSDFRIPFGSISRAWYQSNKQIFTLKSKGKYKELSKKPFFAWWEKDEDLRRFYPQGYWEYKEAKYGHRYPILFRTGRLANSMLSPRSPDAHNFIGKQVLEMGTLVPYAIYHQSDQPRRVIPQRKMIFISGGPKEDAKDARAGGRLKRWTNIVYDHIEQVHQKETKGGR